VHTSAKVEVLITRVFYVGTTSTSAQLAPLELQLPLSNSSWPCHARIRTSTRTLSSSPLPLYTSFLLPPTTTKSRLPRPGPMANPLLLAFDGTGRPRGKLRGHGCSYTFQTLYECLSRILSVPTRKRGYITQTESPRSSSSLHLPSKHTYF
jgi:hypothetical protein